MMLAKCKKDSFAILCGPAWVTGCQASGNPRVSSGRPKWAGMLAEDSRQCVLLCVRHWSEQYTAWRAWPKYLIAWMGQP